MLSILNRLGLYSRSRVSFRETDAWIAQFEALPKVRRYHPRFGSLFRRLAEGEALPDGYAASTVYYQLTGRRGLWLYGDDNAVAAVCMHPHAEGRVLIFPPFGRGRLGLLRQAIDRMPLPPGGIQLARFQENMLGHIHRPLRILREPLLDWLYPCHVLATGAVAKAETHGKHFSEIRRRIRQVTALPVEIVPMRGEMPDRRILRRLWLQNSHVAHGPDGSVRYYEALLFGKRIDRSSLQGQFYRINGVIEGFSVWELPLDPTLPVISLAHLTNRTISGLSDFGMQAMCRELYSQGYERINVGGSEDEGLDVFKRKFMPVYSYQLFSAEVVW